MKINAMIAALLVVGTTVWAGDLKPENVPVVVKDGFNKLYPSATKVKWELDKGNYEAEFNSGKEELEAEFNANGEFIKSESEIESIAKLPQAIQDALKKDYAKYKAEDFELVTLANGKKLYELEMKIEGKKYELLFEESGALVSREEEVKKEK